MMPLGSRLTRPQGGSQVQNMGGGGGGGGCHKFETWEQRRKTLEFFFSETRRCRALIFGMKHLLVDLYQDCSYDAPGVKTDPAPGVTSSKQGGGGESVTSLKHGNKEGKL